MNMIMNRKVSSMLAKRRAEKPYIVDEGFGRFCFARYCRSLSGIREGKFSRELVARVKSYEGGDVSFDLSGVEINFNNLGVLLRAQGIKRAQGYEFETRGLSENMKELFRMCELNENMKGLHGVVRGSVAD